MAIVGPELCREGGGGGIRLWPSPGGGGGFRVGCEGTGFRGTDGGGGIEEAVPEAGVFVDGGVSILVPANKLKSLKSRIVALDIDSVGSVAGAASGGEEETAASLSCTAGFLPSLFGIASP